MINEAAILAVKNGNAVSQKDLFEAVEVVLVGKRKKDRVLSQERAQHCFPIMKWGMLW